MHLFIIFFGLSLFIFLLSLLIAYINKDKRSKALSILLIGILIAVGFLVFVTYSKLDLATQLIYTIFYVFDVPTMTVDFDILNNVPNELLVHYKTLLYIYCVLAPILTVGVIVSFLENKIYELRARLRTRKTVHIFSEINEKSVMLAETLKNKDNIVIMCDMKEKLEFHDRLAKRKCIILKKQINDMNLSNFLGKITIYEIANDYEQNLNKTLSLINMYKDSSKDITVYVFSIKTETQVILDSTDKGNLKTIIINEISQMVYTVLDKVPLYKNTDNNIISVLIIGAGKIGLEFLKAVSWCGQVIGYKLEINVIDKNASQIEKEFLCKCPQLKMPDYSIKFYEADINTTDAYEIISKNCKNTNYVIITLGTDSDNLNCALDMRTFFLRKNKRPIINLSIENSEKKKQIQLLKNERAISYDLDTFGGIEELYGCKNILNERIETLAQKVHLNYSPDDIDLKEYYKIEYNKNSSRATALHLKYKIYSILKEEYCDNNKIIEMLNDKRVSELLAENEHNRWCAYIRSLGYSGASITQVKEYINNTNHHVNHLAKLHPALVPFNKLDKVSSELSKIMSNAINLKENDFKVLETLKNINDQDENN